MIFLLISTGAAEIVLFILSMGFGLPIPLTAVQLLWLNLATNGLQDVALAFEPGEGDEMRQPPRPPGEPIFNRLMIERVVVSALVMGTLGFLAFRHLLLSGVSESDARNSLLLLMVLFENVHIGNCRSETRSAFALSPLRNSLLLAGTIGAQALHIAAMHTPGLSTILGARPVSIQHWVNLLGVALCILVAMELHKLFHYVLRGRKKPRPRRDSASLVERIGDLTCRRIRLHSRMPMGTRAGSAFSAARLVMCALVAALMSGELVAASPSDPAQSAYWSNSGPAHLSKGSAELGDALSQAIEPPEDAQTGGSEVSNARYV